MHHTCDEIFITRTLLYKWAILAKRLRPEYVLRVYLLRVLEFHLDSVNNPPLLIKSKRLM